LLKFKLFLGKTQKKKVEQLKALVKDKMENAFKLDVPLDVEMGTGQNWLEAH
jgi:DNA polymerase-1